METQARATVVFVGPSRWRQVSVVLLAVPLFGLLPAGLALALARSGEPAGVVAAVVIGVIAVGLVVLALLVTTQRWEVAPDIVTMRVRPRRPRVWPRDGLKARAVVTPQYFRGVRVGRTRVLELEGRGTTDSLNVGILGPDGLTALVAALRPPRPERGPRTRRVDEHFPVGRDAIVRYRRWRTTWRLVGVVAIGATALVAGGAFDAGRDALGSMLLATSVTTALYTVFSVAQQVVRRPSGPVPRSMRVTDASVDVELDGTPTPDRHPWPDLTRVEVSTDLQEEAVLRLERRAGDTVEISLTGRVGGDFRADVSPDLDDLLDALVDAGEQHDVTVVGLER